MSEKDIINIGKNLKHLRKLHNLTQQQLADALNIRRSSIGAYEECRAQPKYDALADISDHFKIPIDMFVREDLTNFTDEELKDANAMGYDTRGEKLRVLTISVDDQGRENIELVNQKASAGYLNGYADNEYIGDLPKFQLPMLGAGTFRAFEIKGDSMLPLRSGTIVIGEFLQDFHELKDGQTYIIISSTEGVVYKRVFRKEAADGTEMLTLQSDNLAYPPYDIALEDVREIWRAKMYMSNEFPEADLSLEKVYSVVMDLQRELIKMKNH